ncbi:thioesterase superfamily protein [Colletotrichum orchidophilum]|uniref:Thioesterase superfamily protein n=1 Tax=Colletotrichum orchidophilum TaxID=1209926 RepID=A0A1G4B2T7_9PEZI|nr:thioesterase superfamily protein [Colletotrichum orchidophilum]OHE95739.1 thioesterase superfamily protein [Colletotrichum orchidophilum]
MKSANPDVQHFLGIPWCAAHLNEPDTVRDTAPSRFPKQNTEDQLFSTTLNTADTIAAYLTFYKRPSSSSYLSSTSSTADPASLKTPNIPQDDDTGILVRQLKALLTLRSGVNGYPDVSHGGIVATILDETIGLVFPVNKTNGLVPDAAYMTAYLNVTYLRPVRTPQTILCVIEVTRVVGRKWWIEGRIEDSEGVVLARAESLYVRLIEKL